jgi:hypothetical protein
VDEAMILNLIDADTGRALGTFRTTRHHPFPVPDVGDAVTAMVTPPPGSAMPWLPVVLHTVVVRRVFTYAQARDEDEADTAAVALYVRERVASDEARR